MNGARERTRRASCLAWAVFAVATYSGAATTWTEYCGDTAPTSGKVTIASGDTVVINDAEMATSASCTANVSAGATLQFDTTAAPSLSLTGAGVVEKVSAGNWESSSKSQNNFKGTYVITSGQVGVKAAMFGSRTALDTGTLYATNGATILAEGKSTGYFGSVPVHLGGTLKFSSSTYAYPILSFLTLEGDSTIVPDRNSDAFFDKFDDDHPLSIDLNGHSLTFAFDANSKRMALCNGSLRGSGSLIIAAGSSSKNNTLTLENFSFDAGSPDDVLRMEDRTALAVLTPAALTRTLQLGSANVRFPGPAWTTLSAISGTSSVVEAFRTNAVATGMVFLPAGTLSTGYESGDGEYDSIEEGAIMVGLGTTGGLGVAEGLLVSNKLVVGGTSGFGVIRQTGGEVCMLGSINATTKQFYGSSVGWGSHGYWEISGGEAKMVGTATIGVMAAGLIAQYGGTFVQTHHPLSASVSPSISRPTVYMSLSVKGYSEVPSAIYVAGGSMTITNLLMAHGVASTSILTVGGATALFTSPERIYAGVQSNTTAIVNINDGGTLATPYFAFLKNVDADFFVNFDGGTLRSMPQVAGTSELTTLFGNPLGGVPLVTRVTVGAKGATFDTAGYNRSADVPLAAPTGGVVSAIAFTAETGWAAAPLVLIDGDGKGATAVADFDSSTGTLNGFKVTSGGWGYTAATAKVKVGKTVVREIACTLADATATGGLVKTGAGQLTLNAVNTYGGDTIVSNGVLKAGVEGAFPSASRIVLAGGTVAVASGVTFPSELTVDLPLVEGETYVLSENFSGSELPTIHGADGWKAKIVGGNLVLKYAGGGMTLIFR